MPAALSYRYSLRDASDDLSSLSLQQRSREPAPRGGARLAAEACAAKWEETLARLHADFHGITSRVKAHAAAFVLREIREMVPPAPRTEPRSGPKTLHAAPSSVPAYTLPAHGTGIAAPAKHVTPYITPHISHYRYRHRRAGGGVARDLPGAAHGVGRDRLEGADGRPLGGGGAERGALRREERAPIR